MNKEIVTFSEKCYKYFISIGYRNDEKVIPLCIVSTNECVRKIFWWN